MMGSDLLRAVMCRAPGGVRPQDVFAVNPYNGADDATVTITNGINLSGEGGLVWLKCRSHNSDHMLVDTARGRFFSLSSNLTNAEANTSVISGFDSNGYRLASDVNTNFLYKTFVGWTFRRAPKFFDVVTYPGNGTYGRSVNHNLGAAPGMIIVKRTDQGGDSWVVWHRSASGELRLNTTSAQESSFDEIIGASATTFTLSANGVVNGDGATYVAYLFAHDTDPSGVVQCGSYAGNGSGSGAAVNLGWRPQFLMLKRTDSAQEWNMLDSQRGVNTGTTGDAVLRANLSNAEFTVSDGLQYVDFTATGFTAFSESLALNSSGASYIYLAIREPT